MPNELLIPEVVDNPHYIHDLIIKSKYPNHDSKAEVQWLEKKEKIPGNWHEEKITIIFYEVKHRSFDDSILGKYKLKEILSAEFDVSNFGSPIYRDKYDKGELIDATKKEE